MTKIKGMSKKPRGNADIYTPSDDELRATLEELKGLNYNLYKFYLALIFSGVRIREMERYLASSEEFKVVENGSYVRVFLNQVRGTKSVFYVYLPKDFEIPEPVSLGYLNNILAENKALLRPKYIRNWFYSKCLDVGVPAPIADFFQGRTPITIGNRHYLDKEKLADKLYAEKLVPYFKEFMDSSR